MGVEAHKKVGILKSRASDSSKPDWLQVQGHLQHDAEGKEAEAIQVDEKKSGQIGNQL